MKALSIGELKSDFSRVIDEVQHGAEVTVLRGRAKKPVARIVPIPQELPPRPLGILAGKAHFSFADDWKFASEDDFLGLS